MFELMQLRCFVTVAEELHFGRAARRMNMTQPPFSRQIQILERLLGITLLARSSRSVQLTHAGRAFLVDARRIVRLAESAALTSQRTASGSLGSITLGITAASSYAFVPRLVAQLRQELPDVDLTFKDMVSSEQTEALLSGAIDVGLMRPPIRHPELDHIVVAREGLLIAAPAGGVDGRPPPVSLAEFDGRSTIMFTPDNARYFFDLINSLFTMVGAAPRYVQYITQIHSILALVGAGLGAAVVPEAARSLHFDGVEFTPIPEAKQPVELVLVWRRDSENPVLRRVVALLR